MAIRPRAAPAVVAATPVTNTAISRAANNEARRVRIREGIIDPC
jgi:hypothetical protein